jgi:hypothetical protein
MNYMQNLIQLRDALFAITLEATMRKHIIASLLLCCLTATAWADTVQLRADHPERHVVVKGDTLWDISARFLKDPWLWPKVWKLNREQIKNPHLIYPGDVIVLSLCNGEPCLRLLSEEVRLQPGVRVEELEKKPIPTIPPSVIIPFLSQPLVVDNDALNGAPKIVAAEDGRLLLAPNMKVYVDKLNEVDGSDWQIYRPGQLFIDPETNEELGIEAIYIGDARATRYGQAATVQITRMKQDANIGDLLTPQQEWELTSFVPRAPDTVVTGRVLSTYEGASTVGKYSIVAISRGFSDGLEQGHVLEIFNYGAILPPKKDTSGKQREGYVNFERNEDGSLRRDEEGRVIVRVGTRPADGSADPEPMEIKLPDEHAGQLMVFRTFERVSYGLVMKSERPIQAGDIVTTP